MALRRPSPTALAVSATVVATAAYFVVKVLEPAGEHVALVVGNTGEGVAAAVAAVAAGVRARSLRGRLRRGWALVAAACACWAAGQGLYTWYEVGLSIETPFPSPADLGFLAYPVLMLPAFMALGRTVRAARGSALRSVLDGAAVAASLLTISWATALGQVVQGGAEGPLAKAVGMAYPISDVVLATTAVLFIRQAPRRSGLPLLAVAVALMAVADTGFIYQASSHVYETSSAIDVSWFAAFMLVVVAAVTASPTAPGERRAAVLDGSAPEPNDAASGEALTVVGVLVPYLVVGTGGLVGVLVVAAGGSRELVWVLLVSMIALMGRQMVALAGNRRLARDVLAQRDALHHMAYHDALTGLANRALFAEALDAALAHHRAGRGAVALAVCDLDGFKAVNDTLGHAAGDELLRRVGVRLQAAVRAGDTAARLGGDEFALVVVDPPTPDRLAERVASALAGAGAQEEAATGEAVGVSTGVAVLAVGDAPVDAEVLLRRADAAMYAAKRSRRGRQRPDAASPARAPTVAAPLRS